MQEKEPTSKKAPHYPQKMPPLNLHTEGATGKTLHNLLYRPKK
jgi:hypothetical protein